MTRILTNRGMKQGRTVNRDRFFLFKLPLGTVEMSELTFNIADYRPLSNARTHNGVPSPKARSGFVLMSSNSEPREYVPSGLESRSAVVDIRAVRESRRSCPRRGKILRFGNPAFHRLFTMPSHDAGVQADDDPGPLVA